MDEARLRWRFFWSRRSGGRTVAALLCALCALLLAAYLALPSADQQTIQTTWQTVTQNLGATGARVVIEALLVLFAVASVVALLAPGYRQYRYLTLPTSLIAPISVYVDAENPLPEQSMPALISFLRKFLDGRRADLLFFIDATQASSKRYKTLYRFGFRPVDVPHNPTGAKVMDEAVDRELALHAFERALVGPAGQEFIIISSDGDFAPLVYRLVALGHTVQVWSFEGSGAYLSLAQYLPVTLVDLSKVLAEQAIEPPVDTSADAAPGSSATDAHSAASPGNSRSRARRHRHDTPLLTIAPPTNLPEGGAEPLYYAIAETLRAQRESQAKSQRDQGRNSRFHALLNTTLAPRLASVGYSSGNWVEYWLDHMQALGVLVSRPNRYFPAMGSASAELAARQMYAMAKVIADAAAHATSNRPDGLLSMWSILEQVDATATAGDASAQPLRALVAPQNGRRATHARYFLRCARALGIIQFGETPGSLDLIQNPTLAPSAELDTGADAGADAGGTATA